MQRLNSRVGVLSFLLAATLAACSPSTSTPEIANTDPASWVIVGGNVAPEVIAFLQPTPMSESRVVASRNDRTILRLRESELDTLASFFHDRFERCGGFTAHDSLAEAESVIESEARMALQANQVTESAPLVAAAPDVVQALIPLVSAPQIVSTINGLVAFGTRHYRSTGGVQSATWLRDRWAAMAVGRAGATATLFAHSAWPQPSVMLTIPGDEAPNEVVVIGGHLDTINSNGSANAPGADDDASGVATLTEVARLILSQNVRLRRTVIFMAYAAEEVGLRGSAAIANDFRARNVPVVGVMQLDMTNFDGSPHDIVLITDNVSTTQTDFLATLAARYIPQFPVARDRCGYACSDHASWTRAGYPAVLPHEATLATGNPNIHTSRDTLSVSGNNANHAAKFAKLAIAYTVEMAQVPAN
ncbi:MAG: M20/M25/M40 family metallo-hydrolase [Myxococcales bacterium]|nr:M20/M25/M40 family metallo-hydrolase [Myxococcales bacterium]